MLIKNKEKKNFKFDFLRQKKDKKNTFLTQIKRYSFDTKFFFYFLNKNSKLGIFLF